jgi:uncharacterized membrane protein
MLKLVWGEEKWVGLPTNLYADWIITDGTLDKFRSYNYNDLDVYGCQAKIIIVPGTRQLYATSTLLEYYYYRFVRPAKMEAFLYEITWVTVKPRQSLLATNCKN